MLPTTYIVGSDALAPLCCVCYGSCNLGVLSFVFAVLMQTHDIFYFWYDAIPLYFLVTISFNFFQSVWDLGFNHD
jgi:hypothetical protein